MIKKAKPQGLIKTDNYSLLVEIIGEDKAFLLCESLGGTNLSIPSKVHKIYRVKSLYQRYKNYIDEEDKKKAFIRRFAKGLNLSSKTIYRILQDEQRDNK